MTIRVFECDRGHRFEATQTWMVSKHDCPYCEDCKAAEWGVKDLERSLEKAKYEEMLLCKPDTRISLDT